MKWFKLVVIIAVVLLTGIQFIPVSRNISSDVTSKDFIQTFKPPENVSGILQTSCYNCHSNNTNYPWYSHVQPVGFYLEGHIKEGKEELNLSEFGNYSGRMQKSKLTSMISQVEDNEMPLPVYTLIHRDAKLSREDKEAVTGFLESLKDSI